MDDLERHERLEEDIKRLVIDSTSIRISVRRSIRAVGANGDEFRTAESEETWTIKDPNGPMPPDLAYAAAMRFTPLLIKKVMFDLVVAGVIKKEDAQKRIRYANESYAAALAGGKKPDGSTTGADQREDQQTLRGVGDPLSSSREEPSEGTSISPGEDRRVPPEAGPSSGPSSPSPEASSGSQDIRP